MKKPTDLTLAISAGYQQFVEERDIGRGIVEKQKALGGGESVGEMVAADLRLAFPSMSGFSPRNVWYMRLLYEAYSEPEFLSQAVRETGQRRARPILQKPAAELEGSNPTLFLQQLVAEIPWGHHILMLDKLSAPAVRLWYLRATARFGWSRNVLLNQIKAGAGERAVTEKKTHNFDLALPEHCAEHADEHADEMLKSSCNLEFLGLRRAERERARRDRPGGPAEISRGWSAAEPPDRPTHTFKPRQGRQKFPVQSRSARFCHPCRGSHGLLDGVRWFRSFLAPPPANFFGPSRGRSHVRTKANPIGVAAYALQSKLPGELKGKLPTAKQLADIVRAEMEGGKCVPPIQSATSSLSPSNPAPLPPCATRCCRSF